jgi:hypothetical protein
MKEMVTTPIGLIWSEYTVAFKVGENDEYEFTASEYARFIDIAFNLIDEKTGELFNTVASTYSMN